LLKSPMGRAEEQFFLARTEWLVRLRWVVLAAATLGGVLLRRMGLIQPPWPLLAVALFVGAYNAFFFLGLRAGRPRGPRMLMAQIALDQLALALVVYFSGSCDSPFIYFFLLHIVVSASVLPWRYTVGFASLSVLYPALVLGLTHWGWLPRWSLFAQSPYVFRSMSLMLSYGSIYVVAVFCLAYIAGYLGRRMQEHRAALQRANLRLEALLKLSEAGTESQKVLSESLQSLLGQPLRAWVVELLHTPQVPCHEHLRCQESDCPAHGVALSCWRLLGTRCAHPLGARGPRDKLQACPRCRYLSELLASKLREHLEDITAQEVSRALQRGAAVLQRAKPWGRPRLLLLPLLTPEGELFALLALYAPEGLGLGAQKDAVLRDVAERLAAEFMRTKLYWDLERSYTATVLALGSAIEATDPYTRGHSERVAKLSAQIAQQMGLSSQEVEHLRLAALLHDVGKIGVSREVLGKRCSLNECERQEVQEHLRIGVRILEPVEFLRPVLPAIRHHHEHYDGSGYPSGLRGKEIPLLARVLAVADAWDAMLSDRPYRRALSPREAAQEMLRNAGSQFDPQVVEALLRLQDLGQLKQP